MGRSIKNNTIITAKLNKEWSVLKKDWFSVYNWNSLSRKGYSEEVAKILLNDIDKIKINSQGLRQKNFRVVDHYGQCQLATDISQHVEKRFCRALYNLRELPLLGVALDYEVPLKEERGAKHGDIDLLTLKKDKLFLVEAKKINSSESILKAILETYVYSSLVCLVKKRFYKDFDIKPDVKIAPAILVFANSTAGQQIMEIDKYENIKLLIRKLNGNLKKIGAEKMSFYLITNKGKDVEDSLRAKPFDEKRKLIVLKKDFNLEIKQIIIK